MRMSPLLDYKCSCQRERSQRYSVLSSVAKLAAGGSLGETTTRDSSMTFLGVGRVGW